MGYSQNDALLWQASKAKEDWLAAARTHERIQDKIDALRLSQMSAGTSKLTGMPRASSPGDAMGDYYVRLVELEDQERRLLDFVRKKYIAFIVAEYKTIKAINSSDEPELLGMRYLMGFSYRKIADLAEMSEAAARSKIKKAVEDLKIEN